MFIRWKKRKKLVSEGGPKEETNVLYPIVCMCERVNGKPRQKFVAHLGHIAEFYFNYNGSLCDFWHDVRIRLSALKVDDQTRDKLIGQIAKVVPYKTEDEWRQDKNENAAIYANWVESQQKKRELSSH